MLIRVKLKHRNLFFIRGLLAVNYSKFVKLLLYCENIFLKCHNKVQHYLNLL